MINESLTNGSLVDYNLIAMRWLLMLTGLLFIGCGSYREAPEPPLRVMHKNADWMVPFAKGFHGFAVRDNYWDLNSCRVCHGKDLAGDKDGSSCKVCHSNKMEADDMPHQRPGSCIVCHKKGPSACNTCHGSNKNNAPPHGVEGQLSTDYIGVGAHQRHVVEGKFTRPISCNQCHPNTPKGHPAVDHADLVNHAAIKFGTYATGDGKLQPVWDRKLAICSNVMCHGWPGAEGKRKLWVWNKSLNQGVKCGDCHALPPKKAPDGIEHPDVKGLDSCAGCHGAVVDKTGKIINKKLHINGKFDGSGQ